MNSSGFSSPRSDCFPAGLRVLVVDDDPTWLKILEKMLKKCNYEVTTCNLAREALDLLRGRKDGYDIVISDVNMPDMDGFKLLEHVGLELDLPVIMMSVDGETSRVMKGVQHGACDYLLKPIRMKELRNIWQHVIRKRKRDTEGHESLEDIQMLMRIGAEQSDDGYLFSGDFFSGRKRKDFDHNNKHINEDRVCPGDPSSAKKARVVWTVDLHQKFVKAVNLIGFEKVGPKKILDLMGVPWLTRENVASHLQKYRLYLSRLQKENELKATFDPTKGQSCPISRNNLLIDNDDTKIFEANMKDILSVPITELKKACSDSRISFDLHSFGTSDSNVKSKSTTQGHQYSWNTEPSIHFKKDQPPFKKFDHLTTDPVHRVITHKPGTSSTESNNLDPSYGESRSQNVSNVQPESHLTDIQAVDPIPCSTWKQNLFDNPESSQRNLTFGWYERFDDYPTRSEFQPPEGYFGNLDLLGSNSSHGIVADYPPHLYDPLKFDSEYLSDHVEYPVIDQGLFIA